MKKVLMAAAAVLMLGTSVASASVNFSRGAGGNFSYQTGTNGMGNAPFQNGG